MAKTKLFSEIYIDKFLNFSVKLFFFFSCITKMYFLLKFVNFCFKKHMKKLFFNDYHYLYIYIKRIILLNKAIVNNLARSKSENNFIGCLLSTTIKIIM